jgi:sugar phosphate isomerase/epimerase
MRAGAAHLTYCTNIHPGETWDEVRSALVTHVTGVKARVAPEEPFGVGLRLSGQAADALADGRALDELRGLLDRHGLYVFTINGFPYGAFHGTRVKERVYRPDWLEPERTHYTQRLARVLAALLPEGLVGSVSTVPGCFRPRAEADAGSEERVAEALRARAADLVRLRETSGRTIVLALEPEPACLIETIAEAVAFFEERLLARDPLARFAVLSGLGAAEGEAALRRHLGVCLDACHAAVEFEEPASAVAALRGAGIATAKVQLSAGLVVRPVDAAARQALRTFADEVYLHQVVARGGSRLRRFNDLPEALASTDAPEEEWRVHFHVPLFARRLGPFENTQPFLEELLALHRREPIAPHLEVETYTWGVLPEALRSADVVDSVARELAWVRARLPA